MRGEWIPGYEGRYAITRQGRVFSVPRSGTRGGWLKQSPNSQGYLRVNLTNPNGSQSTKNVHVLVLLTYDGPKPEGMQACHNNGDKTDNRLENLRWDTPSSNNLDKRKHGTSGGEKNGRAKLTAEQVTSIRDRYEFGDVSLSRLAYLFGVDKSTIHRVVSGTSWTQQ